jgi:hypothetical protein
MENREVTTPIPNSVKKMLLNDELVLASIQQSRLKEVITPDTLVVTNQRVIRHSPSTLGLRKEIEDYRYGDIGNFKVNKGIVFAIIEIVPRFMSKGVKIENLPRGQVDHISKIVLENIKHANNAQKVKAPTNIEDPFKVLKLRFAKGEISKNEFEEMKKELN